MRRSRGGSHRITRSPWSRAARTNSRRWRKNCNPRAFTQAYLKVDGAIDTPFIRERFQGIKDEDMLKPSAIAETYWFSAHQDPSAWTHALELRPFSAKWWANIAERGFDSSRAPELTN